MKNKNIATKKTKNGSITPATTYVGIPERCLMRQWKREGKSKTEIMKLTGRSKNAVNLNLKRNAKKTGAKPSVTKQVFRRLNGALNKLLRKKKAQKEVTVDMVKALAKFKGSNRAVLDAFHKHTIYFRPLRLKPILKKGDVKLRKGFSLKFKSRTTRVWVKKPNAIIDCKMFPLYRDASGRAEAARRQVRGGYRPRAQGPKPWLVKNNPAMKFPVKGVRVTAAVINGKIRMWRYLEGKRWNAKEAVKMYKGQLRTALKRNFPGQKTFSVMEDNDPAGYKSKAALFAKAAVGIKTLRLPPRSPDLNVLDYSLWHAINVAMRKQEEAMNIKKTESAAAFKERLRKCALGLPKKTVTKAVMDMRRRVQLMHKAKGGQFKE